MAQIRENKIGFSCSSKETTHILDSLPNSSSQMLLPIVHINTHICVGTCVPAYYPITQSFYEKDKCHISYFSILRGYQIWKMRGMTGYSASISYQYDHKCSES